jgi:hypothetical protein
MVPGMMGAAGGPLLDSFRSGLGFDYDAIGEDTLCGLCRCAYCSVCARDLSLGLSPQLVRCVRLRLQHGSALTSVRGCINPAPCPRFLHGPTRCMESLSA